MINKLCLYDLILYICRKSMTEIDDKYVKMIKERLDVLIYLQLRTREIESMTGGEQIFLLKRLGFDDNEIAHMFGKTRGYISGEIVRQKGKKKENE